MLSRTFDLLIQDRWRPAGPGTPLYHRSRLADATGINLVRGRFGHLNLHRSAFPAHGIAPEDDPAIWERSAAGRLGQTIVQVPSAADAVAIALAHGKFTAGESHDWLADIAALIDAGLDWTLFASVVRQRGLQASAAMVLHYVRERLDRAVPPNILAELEHAAVRRPLLLLTRWAEMRPNSRGVGPFRAARAVARQMQLRRNWRRWWFEATRRRPVASLVSRTNAADQGEPALQNEIGLLGRVPGEAWRGTIDLALLVALPAVARRVDFEVNSINRHHFRLRALVRNGGVRERLLRFRFSISLTAEESGLLVAALPTRTLNTDAPPELLARHAAAPFRIADVRIAPARST